jgi:predicted dehydrogenase
MELGGVDFVGACEPQPEADQYPFEVFPDIESLVAQGVDYCVVAVPTSAHLDVATFLAQSDIHCLIEKPLAATFEEAKALKEIFAAKGLIAAVGHIERFNAASVEARRRIEEGQIGRVIQISSSRQGPFPGRLYDVGVGLDLATHDIDLAMWLSQSRYTSIAAQSSHESGHAHEDLLVITGLMSNGVVVNHLINWLSPRKERTVAVLGERGLLQIDTLTSDLTFFENGSIPNEWGQVAQHRGITQGDVTRFAFPKKEPLLSEHEAFAAAVKGLPASVVMLADGAEVVRVAATALDAAREGKARVLRDE